jgi:hypothetical protein
MTDPQALFASNEPVWLAHQLTAVTLAYAPVPVKTTVHRQARRIMKLRRAQAHGAGSSGARLTASCSAARCHGFRRGAGGAGRGAVSRMNCSRAATTAAASSGLAVGATMLSFGRRFTVEPAYRARP